MAILFGERPLGRKVSGAVCEFGQSPHEQSFRSSVRLLELDQGANDTWDDDLLPFTICCDAHVHTGVGRLIIYRWEKPS